MEENGSPERETNKYGQMIFNQNSMKRTASTNGARTTEYHMGRRRTTQFYLTHYTKILNSSGNLNVKSKSLKLSKETQGENICNFGSGKVSLRKEITFNPQKKISYDFSKIKNLMPFKDC